MRFRVLTAVGLLCAVLPIASSGSVSATDRLAPGERRCFTVNGLPGDAAIVNLTLVEASGPGFGQLVSSSITSPPLASNVNYLLGTVNPNVAIAPIGPDGRVCYLNANLASVHLVADHLGNIDAAAFELATASGAPSRKIDTRITGAKVRPSGRLCFAVAGDPGDAAVVNLTPVEADGPGFGQLVSSDVSNPPVASNVNYFPGTVDPNVAVASIGADGKVCYVNGELASVHLVADHLGSIDATVFAPATASGASSRRIDTRTQTPATAPLLDQLVVAPPNTSVPYNRDDWSVWIDADRDCRNTRAEVLIRETRQPVTFTMPTNCTVATGQWYDAWTNSTFTLASDVDIDHTVPLSNAHRSGAWQWDNNTKRSYANELDNPEALRPMDDGANSSKSDKGPEAWKPPHTPSWCGYATDWATIKDRWDLTITQAEYNALDSMLDTCASRPRSSGKIAAGERRCFAVAGDPGDAAIINLTPVEADGPGNGQLVASNVTNPPVASNVNFTPGSVDPNVAITTIGDDGQVCYVNDNLAAVHLVADHLGNIDATTFTPATASGAPDRRVDTRIENPPPPTSSTTTSTTTTTTTVPQPPPNCDPSYPTVCIPPPPPDLNCADIPFRNFVVLQPDPHRFDGDKDGIGCVG
jgi:Protein of unknown function (DUF1524)